MGDRPDKVPGYLLEGQLHQHGGRWYLFTPSGKRDVTSVLESMAGREVRLTLIAREDLRELAEQFRGSFEDDQRGREDDEGQQNQGVGGTDPPSS